MSERPGGRNIRVGELFDLRGKVALVVGGSRGLGHSMSLALAEAGADIIVASRKIAKCEEVAREIRELTGRNAAPLTCHIGKWDGLDDVADRAFSEFGHLDILVNNAGMSPLFGALSEVSEELYDKVLAVNLKGPFRLSVLVGDRMAEQENGGSIINVGSVGGAYSPRPRILPYSTAKTGLLALTVGLSHAFGPKVRVNCVLPGPFLTDVSHHWDMNRFEKRIQNFALRRGGHPDEIVGAVLYFASPASSFTTGSLLRVDGGEL